MSLVSSRRHSYLAAIPLSFFSVSLYQDVIRRWRGLGLAFLCLVSLLTAIPIGYLLWQNGEFLESEAPVLAEQMPLITIENGQAKIALDTGETMREIHVSSGELIGVLYTGMDSPPSVVPDTGFVLTPHYFLLRSHDFEQRMTFESIDYFELTPEQFPDFLRAIVRMMQIIVLPFSVLMVAGMRLIQAGVFALIASAAAMFMGISLPSWKVWLRLSIVAMTPATIIDFLLGPAIVNNGLVIFAVTLAYMYFAVRIYAAGEQQPKTD